MIQCWTARPENQSEASNATWRQLEQDVRNQLNVPNVKEQTRLKILQGLAYQQKAEVRARDYSDPLADSLGRPQKRAEPEPSSLVPKKGPVLTRLGELVSEPLTLRKVSSTGGLTQDQPEEVHQDQAKGKEPQVSGPHWVTRDHRIPRSKRARPNA